MVNRNSARHLLLIVSILLCFFVYMGYRLWGRGKSAAPAVPQYPAFESDSDVVSAPVPSGEGLRPPSDVSVPIDDEDSVWVPSSPPASTPHSGAITGLIPSPPADDSTLMDDDFVEGEAMAALPGLPVPTERDSAVESPLPTPPAAGLRPPLGGVEEGESESVGGSAFAPPPAGSGTTASAAPVMPPPSAVITAAESETAAPPTPPVSATVDRDDDGWSTAPSSAPSPESVTTPPAQRDGPSPYGPYQELPESLRIYVVLPGDSLSSIAARELGSASLAENIFLLNRDVIEDPDHLLAGVKIRLPVRETATYDEPAAPDVTGRDVAGRRPAMGLGRTHIVVRGDTLSSIALQYYGSSAGWRFLYDANRTVLPNPNQLTVGTELTIPPYEQ